jgi:hypothetical protein
MKYRIHFRVTDGAKVYNAFRDMDYIPPDKGKVWVDGDDGKFSGDVVVHCEMGIRTEEDGKTKVQLSCYPMRYDD